MPETPSLAQELDVALAGMRSEMAAPETSPAPIVGAPPAVETSVPVTDSEGLPPAPDKGVRPPMLSGSPDLDHVPQEIRDAFVTLPPEALQWVKGVKGGVMAHAKFTQEMQALARKREQLEEDKQEVEALKGDAALARRLRKDEDLLRYLREREAKGSTPEEEDGGEVDPTWFDLPPAEAATRMSDWQRKVLAASERRTQRILHDRFEKPAQEQLAIGQVLEAEFILNRGEDPEVVKSAGRAAGQMARAAGVKVTPENVVALVEPHLAIAKSATNKATVPPTVAANGVSGRVRQVATPSVGGGMTPLPAPAYLREGRTPTSGEDYSQSVLRKVSEAFGREVTEADLMDALRNPEG